LRSKIDKSHILVTASVAAEAEGIKSQLTSLKQHNIGRKRVFGGEIGDVQVRLIVTGPGMVNTARALRQPLKKSHPGSS
jgi:hypothetical protein